MSRGDVLHGETRTPVDGNVVGLATIEAGEGSGGKEKDSGSRGHRNLKERHGGKRKDGIDERL